jgi:hypothetical protein
LISLISQTDSTIVFLNDYDYGVYGSYSFYPSGTLTINIYSLSRQSSYYLTVAYASSVSGTFSSVNVDGPGCYVAYPTYNSFQIVVDIYDCDSEGTVVSTSNPAIVFAIVFPVFFVFVCIILIIVVVRRGAKRSQTTTM